MHRERGLTLLELSIGLIIIGLILVPILSLYNLHLAEQEKVRSDGNLLVIQSALQKYAIRNGRYPIPAARNLAPTDPNFGQEYGAAMGNCVGGDPLPCRAPGYRDVEPSDGFMDPVLIGDLPIAALGLPIDYAMDGFENKFTYAVTESLTDDTTFDDANGVIRMIDGTGAARQGTNDNVHYVVMSHGQNRKGAFSLDGLLIEPCAAPGRDVENCDNTDGLFTDNFDMEVIDESGFPKYLRRQEDALGPSNYDDYARFVITTATDIWTRTASFATPDIFNRNDGNTRIGPGGTPVAKVEVMGDTRSDGLETNRLCEGPGCDVEGGTGGLVNPWAPKYFTPKIIGDDPHIADAGKPGGGILCDEMGLTGISEADELCEYNTLPGALNPGMCPPGSYANGTDANGDLVCQEP